MRWNVTLFFFSGFCCLAACRQHTPPDRPQKSSGVSHQLQTPVINQADSSSTRIEGQYRNPEYGYLVNLPPGTTAITAAPPNPQHGFRIDLTPDQANFIWVDGSYNAAEYESAQEALRVYLEDVAGKRPLKIKPVHLGQLTGATASIRYDDPHSKQPRIEEEAVALRKNEVVYTIGLQTSEARYAQDQPLFEKIVKSFQLTDLPQ